MKFYKVDICDQQVRRCLSFFTLFAFLTRSILQDVAMDASVTLAPSFHFYRGGSKVKEYVGSSYPALEVRFSLLPSAVLFTF
jgi:hypothetical protein